MSYIYQFPELKPGVRAGNMDWFRMPKLLGRKIAALGDVERVVVNGPMNVYENGQKKLTLETGLPVMSRIEVGDVLPAGTLSLYFTNWPTGGDAFKRDFGLIVGEYGKIIMIEEDEGWRCSPIAGNSNHWS